MHCSDCRRTHWSRWALPVLMIMVLTISARARQQDEPEPGFHIVVLQGEGALNGIKQRSSQELAVRVEDQNGKPLPGVPVTFQLPPVGPSGSFPDGGLIMMRTTDAKGEARTSGLRPNDVQGDFQIKLIATYQGESVTALIRQSNVMAVGSSPQSSSHKRLLTILAIAGGAGAAIALSQRGGGNAASASSGGISSGVVSAATPQPGPPPISLVPGTPVVTGPQ